MVRLTDAVSEVSGAADLVGATEDAGEEAV